MNKVFRIASFRNQNEMKSVVIRYGIAILAVTITAVVFFSLRYYSIRINLTILLVLALIIPAWYGGKGPGITVAIFFELISILTIPRSPETSILNYIFSHFSLFIFYVFLVVLVSSRRKSENILRDQREFLEITLSSIGDAVIAADTNGRVNFINPTAELLTGWSKTVAIGEPIDDVVKIISEPTREPLENPINKVLRGEKCFGLPSDTFLITKSGTEIPIDDSCAPIMVLGNKVVGAVLAFRDVSERRIADKALFESERRLQQAQKMEAIGTLTGGVAHDFNNLLTAILGNTQLAIRDKSLNETVLRQLREVLEAGDRAAILTRQLLAFSRQQQLERRNINLNDAIAGLLRMLERIIGEDIEITVKYESDLPIVLVDAAQIEQVIMNLAVNARDAMPNGGRLLIKTGQIELDESYCRKYPYMKPGTYVQIIVSDTGVGMDDSTKAHLFEPFFTTKEVGKGTGLGLSIAYGIVKQHEGNINVYSEPQHGSTFKVFLPVNDGLIEQEKAQLQDEISGGRETILIAEDEEILRILAAEILESLGYKVLLANNGTEAIEIFANNQREINLLLFDVVMPSKGGPEAFEEICSIAADVPPVIFMTGYSSEIIENSFVSYKNTGKNRTKIIIQKPYSVDGLGRKVREVLDSIGEKLK